MSEGGEKKMTLEELNSLRADAMKRAENFAEIEEGRTWALVSALADIAVSLRREVEDPDGFPHFVSASTSVSTDTNGENFTRTVAVARDGNVYLYEESDDTWIRLGDEGISA